MKKAIVWRKSIYDNDYKCKCGFKLMNGDDVADEVLVDVENDKIYCPMCGWLVAKITTLDKAIQSGAMRGEA